MTDLYCDAVLRIFTVGVEGAPALAPEEFASLKGNVQRRLIDDEGLGRLIRAWSNLTVAVDARTLEIRGLDSPAVRGDEDAILAHAVREMNEARDCKPELRLPDDPDRPPRPPGPVCTIAGPVHDDIFMRRLHLGDRPWTLTSGELTLAIGILLDVTLPLYSFDRA